MIRRASLNRGDLVINRLGCKIVLSSRPSLEDNEELVGVMGSNDVALVIDIIGSGTSQSAYVVTSHGMGWIASAEVEAVVVLMR